MNKQTSFLEIIMNKQLSFFFCTLLTIFSSNAMEQPHAYKTHYDLLGVSRTATTETITKTYRTLARQHHPDKNIDNMKAATEHFNAIRDAYEILSDPQKRMMYDMSLPLDDHLFKDFFTTENFYTENPCYHQKAYKQPAATIKCHKCFINPTNQTYLTPCCWQSSNYARTINLCDSCAFEPTFLIRCPYCTINVITIRHNEGGSILLNESFICNGLPSKIKNCKQWTDKRYYTPCCNKQISLCDNCVMHNKTITCPHCNKKLC